MRQERCFTMTTTSMCIVISFAVHVAGSPNWPTHEFFGQQYHNAVPNSELGTDVDPGANFKPEQKSVSPYTVTSAKDETDTTNKMSKPRWSTRRRMSAREAVAVMEQELQRREAARSETGTGRRNESRKDGHNADSMTASTNRRSGHHMGVTGPVHTFVKTDKHGHYKWGVRHHAGHGFA